VITLHHTACFEFVFIYICVAYTYMFLTMLCCVVSESLIILVLYLRLMLKACIACVLSRFTLWCDLLSLIIHFALVKECY